ncbi:MAG: thiamine-binding protein [Deltaproteobacteria bacterium]|nr:thiamine-binding protein [Deltaproteobacteria bacterium]
MIVSAQLSVYPLRQESLTPGIRIVNDALVDAGLSPEVGPMSTVTVGEADLVFAALRDGFTRAATQGHLVMTVTISNACPV